MNWTALPAEGMPGPALAISVDSDTSVFAAGVSATDGTSSYLIRWDGEQWSDVRGSAQDQNPLQIASSSVQQLLVAPTTSEVDTDYFSANDRVLLVSGQLNMASSGSASSAIFDGFAWYPFLLSSTAAGAAGTVAGLFYPASAIQFSRHSE